MADIYGLYDRAGNLRYIGKANNPADRLKRHMLDVGRRKTPVYSWLKKHGVPEIRVLEANCVDWREAERRLIRESRMRGENLLNLADGGDEPFCSPQQRQINARRMQDHPNTVAQRKINGKKLSQSDGRKPDGSDYTAEEVIIYAYTSVLKMALKGGRVRTMEKVLTKMRERFAQQPDKFPAAWQHA